jgi:hypothetical protein
MRISISSGAGRQGAAILAHVIDLLTLTLGGHTLVVKVEDTEAQSGKHVSEAAAALLVTDAASLMESL